MGAAWRWLALALLVGSLGVARAEDEEDTLEVNTVDEDLGASKEGSRTDSETLQREEEAIKLDGLSVAEMKLMRESAEKHVFQVNWIRPSLVFVQFLSLGRGQPDDEVDYQLPLPEQGSLPQRTHLQCLRRFGQGTTHCFLGEMILYLYSRCDCLVSQTSLCWLLQRN